MFNVFLQINPTRVDEMTWFTVREEELIHPLMCSLVHYRLTFIIIIIRDFSTFYICIFHPRIANNALMSHDSESKY